VVTRWQSWKRNRKNQSQYLPQLEWEAHICEYVSYLAKQTRSTKGNGLAVPLDAKVPILGPRFVPPTYMHNQKRNVSPEVAPDTVYLKPLNVVHPFYYPDLHRGCPQ
ncbi:hypothetical protein GY45DRAFT_1216361, partial [Cubamyces sp. BRFM 1775]